MFHFHNWKLATAFANTNKFVCHCGKSKTIALR